MIQLKVLEDEARVRQEALDAARESLRLTQNQYKAGLIAYLDVVTVQATALSNERSVLSLQQSRLIASVQLIAALGGGGTGSCRLANRLPRTDTHHCPCGSELARESGVSACRNVD